MANLKAIRRRIGSVKNTQKITRAMKMVAAARLRKAQEAVEAFRSYADLTSTILAEVAGDATAGDHPLLKRREPKKSLLIVICSDRGLCGGFNGNLFRDIFKYVQETDPEPEISIIGRKAVDFFKRRPVTINHVYEDIFDNAGYETAAGIARELAEKYASEELDSIQLVYNEFVSMISQKPTFSQLLPVVLPEQEDKDNDEWVVPPDFIFEPNRAELLSKLLPQYVEVQVYRALIESIAAEHAARMTAMDNATKNAEEMLDHLTLVYNRARQSAITADLMDIVGGAEALND
ncbi:MAG: ATP synthase F1 subunit gamma [Deltaproteobacteria bacterium]|nr:ATP synthase F1 subunit gamma [Deltaproteobacteria bacterium]